MQGYTKEDLLLMYRRNPKYDWIQIPFTVAGNNVQGYLITNHIEPGEYMLAVGNYAVGIDETNAQSTFSVYPSPADRYFQCQFNDSSWENAKIQIFSMEGKQVMETQYQNDGQMINIQQLATGHYIVKATNKDQQVQNSKLIIVR
jgi:hypothetical protein